MCYPLTRAPRSNQTVLKHSQHFKSWVKTRFISRLVVSRLTRSLLFEEKKTFWFPLFSPHMDWKSKTELTTLRSWFCKPWKHSFQRVDLKSPWNLDDLRLMAPSSPLTNKTAVLVKPVVNLPIHPGLNLVALQVDRQWAMKGWRQILRSFLQVWRQFVCLLTFSLCFPNIKGCFKHSSIIIIIIVIDQQIYLYPPYNGSLYAFHYLPSSSLCLRGKPICPWSGWAPVILALWRNYHYIHNFYCEGCVWVCVKDHHYRKKLTSTIALQQVRRAQETMICVSCALVNRISISRRLNLHVCWNMFMLLFKLMRLWFEPEWFMWADLHSPFIGPSLSNPI